MQELLNVLNLKQRKFHAKQESCSIPLFILLNFIAPTEIESRKNEVSAIAPDCAHKTNVVATEKLANLDIVTKILQILEFNLLQL